MINNTGAFAAFKTIIDEQQEKQQPVAIAYCDSHGELLLFVKMDGVSLHSGVLAQNKAYTSARDRQATADIGVWSRSSGRSLDYWGDPRFTGFGGGVPLRFRNTVIGAIGVSGLSEQDDAQLAERLAQLLINKLTQSM